jgi:O-antigen ligase
MAWTTPHAAPAFGWASSAERRGVRGLFGLQLRLAVLTVLLIPLNWVLGTALLWVYAVAAVLMLSLERLSLLEAVYGVLSAVLIFALGIAIANEGGVAGDRVLASLYNLTIVTVLVAYANFGRKAQLHSPDQAPLSRKIYRAAFWCFAAQLVWIGAVHLYTAATGLMQIETKTLIMGAFGGLPGVLAQYSKLSIVITDWLKAGPDTRIIGFGVYATEGALLLLVIGLLAAIHAAARRRWLVLVGIEIMIAVALVEMASRTTLLAYLISLGLMAGLWARRIASGLLLMTPLLIVGTVIAAIYGPDFLKDAFSASNEARAGSSGERFKSYLLAIDLVRETNILTGLGVKPRDDSILSIPIGSHSSFISSFTKGGLVGLATMVTIYGVLLWQVIRSQLVLFGAASERNEPRRFEIIYLSRCVLVVLTWWVTEDFDAPAHAAALAGLAIGLFWGLLERRRAAARSGWSVRLAAPSPSRLEARRLLNPL